MLANNSNKKLILCDFDETITANHLSGLIRKMKHLSISSEDLLTNSQKQRKIWQLLLEKQKIHCRGNSENNNLEWRQLLENLIDSDYEFMILTYSEFPFVIDLFLREIIQLDKNYLSKIIVIYGIAYDYGKSHIQQAREIAQKTYENSEISYIENEPFNIDQGKALGINTIYLHKAIDSPIAFIRENLNCPDSTPKKSFENNSIANGITFVRYNTQKSINLDLEVIKGFHYMTNLNNDLEYSETNILVPQSKKPKKVRFSTDARKLQFNLENNEVTEIRFNLPTDDLASETSLREKRTLPDYRIPIAIGFIIGLAICIPSFLYLPSKKVSDTARALISIIVGMIAGLIATLIANKAQTKIQKHYFPQETTLPTLTANISSESLGYEENYAYSNPLNPEIKKDSYSDFIPSKNLPLNSL